MTPRTHRTLAIVASAAAALAAGTANINCGTIAYAADEDRLLALETKVAQLSMQIEPLRAIAELACAVGQGLRWDGARWTCANPYRDQNAVAAVAATDAYVTKFGDSTITGNVTVSGTTATTGLSITSGEAQFGEDSLRFWRASFSRSDSVIRLTNDGVTSELDIGNGTQDLQSSMIAYRAGSATSDARLMFNIADATSLRCTLLHGDDDLPIPGIYFATDSGNNHEAVWGNPTTRTFDIARQGAATHVIANGASYHIVCF